MGGLDKKYYITLYGMMKKYTLAALARKENGLIDRSIDRWRLEPSHRYDGGAASLAARGFEGISRKTTGEREGGGLAS